MKAFLSANPLDPDTMTIKVQEAKASSSGKNVGETNALGCKQEDYDKTFPVLIIHKMCCVMLAISDILWYVCMWMLECVFFTTESSSIGYISMLDSNAQIPTKIRLDPDLVGRPVLPQSTRVHPATLHSYTTSIHTTHHKPILYRLATIHNAADRQSDRNRPKTTVKLKSKSNLRKIRPNLNKNPVLIRWNCAGVGEGGGGARVQFGDSMSNHCWVTGPCSHGGGHRKKGVWNLWKQTSVVHRSKYQHGSSKK